MVFHSLFPFKQSKRKIKGLVQLLLLSHVYIVLDFKYTNQSVGMIETIWAIHT